MKTAILLSALILSSCASGIYTGSTTGKGSTDGYIGQTQAQFDKMMEEQVGKKEYKKWQKAVSDDSVVIEFYDKNGKKQGSAIAK